MKHSLQNKLHTLCRHTEELVGIYQPGFYRLNIPSNKAHFEALLEIPGLKVFDYLHDQLRELIKTRNPSKKLDRDEIDSLITVHLDGIELYEYGVWVYYPWSHRLVHIVDEIEFIELRTSRNLYKITPQERDILGQKKIGIIGLSVGQSVAITLAMERVIGELRLADFDLLELTNLNRIRTGVHNLGISKVISVAREILEIDPFLHVRCFPKGLTEENMNDFFLEGGKLDLLIEESDGFDIKVLSRYKARELKIPVIMEASDRCTVDVERFDHEPNRSILHGTIDHLDIKTLKNLKTTEDKIPYLLDMVGLATASTKLKASMLEIDQTITTWPQLASAVTMGGGIMTDISRRILLNTYTESGRYHIDIEELIADRSRPASKEKLGAASIEKTLSLEEMKNVAEVWFKENSSVLKPTYETNNEQLNILVKAATMAPSGGNMQPWNWYYHNKYLFLFHDIERSASLLDYDSIAACISLGAAIENLVLKAHELGIEALVQTFPQSTTPRLFAIISFWKELPNTTDNQELHTYDYLSAQIPYRHTNRTIESRKTLPKEHYNKLREVTESIAGAQLHVVDAIEEIKQLGNIIGQVERIRIMNKRGHTDFVHEIRWSPEENIQKKDGVDIATIDLTTSEKAGFMIAQNPDVINELKQWKGGKAFERLSKKTIEASSAIVLITMPEYSHVNFLNGGRAVERMWLEATKLGISVQPQSPSTFLFSRISHGEEHDLTFEEREELNALYKEFLELFHLPPTLGYIFMFRLCVANTPEVKSLRRPLDEVLFYDQHTFKRI